MIRQVLVKNSLALFDIGSKYKWPGLVSLRFVPPRSASSARGPGSDGVNVACYPSGVVAPIFAIPPYPVADIVSNLVEQRLEVADHAPR